MDSEASLQAFPKIGEGGPLAVDEDDQAAVRQWGLQMQSSAVDEDDRAAARPPVPTVLFNAKLSSRGALIEYGDESARRGISVWEPFASLYAGKGVSLQEV